MEIYKDDQGNDFIYFQPSIFKQIRVSKKYNRYKSLEALDIREFYLVNEKLVLENKFENYLPTKKGVVVNFLFF